MSTQYPSNPDPDHFGEPEKITAEAVSPGNRNRQLSQSRVAIISVVTILFVTDLLTLFFLMISGTTPVSGTLFSTPRMVLSTIIDVFLGINLLRDKSWARTWILIRSILGVLIWGGIYLTQSDYSDLIFNTGTLLAIIILLTLPSKSLTIWGSITLAVVTAVGAIGYPFAEPMIKITSVPETSSIPNSFSTYISEGFFSISYPSEWAPTMDVIKDAETSMKQYLSDEGMAKEASEVQLVFLATPTGENDKFAFAGVSVEPRSSWPLEILIDNTYQFSLKNVDQYVEQSRIKTTIDGKPAIIQTYQANDDNSILTGYTTAYIMGSKFLWTVVCGCELHDFTAYQGSFEQVVKSLRVEY